jgi:hypothetical protein
MGAAMKSAAPSQRTPSPLRGILVGGLIAGILDITYAVVTLFFRGRSPLWTLQSVASGLLGNKAFEGGLASGLLGLLAHFTIAIGAAATYWIASRRIGVLRHHPVISGLLFGVLIYLFMNFVVLPLSAFPLELKYPIATLAKGFLFHALLIGLPIALSLRYAGGLQPDPSLQRTPIG